MTGAGEILAQPVRKRTIAKRISDRWTYSLDEAFSSENFLLRDVRRDVASASRVVNRSSVNPPRHLLIPTVGKGNIGDQAMLEAFLVNTTWPVTLIVQHDDGHLVPADAVGRVRKVVIPELFTTRPWIRRRVRRRIAELISTHTTLSVVGADLMDGGYGSAESTIRFGMLCIGNEVGVPSRALGFSWNGVAPTEVQRALSFSQPSSLLCLRDPHSFTRMHAEGSYNVVQTADTVFTLDRVVEYGGILPWLHAQVDRQVVIVNVSGILARNGVHPSEYVQIIRHLVERGCSVVLLPHVIRAGDDDLAACVGVAEGLGQDPRIYLVEDLLMPAQVAWLARQAAAVLTGRMHLSILSLNQGVPPAVLSTQGKVSGLMELFGIPEFTLEPRSGFAVHAIQALDRILDDPSIRTRLLGVLPDVRELARLNFADLEPAPN